MSAELSPHCAAHDEWLIMTLCMYVGYRTGNDVSNFGSDPVAQLNFKNVFQKFILSFIFGIQKYAQCWFNLHMRDGAIHYKLYLLQLTMAVDYIVFSIIKGGF